MARVNNPALIRSDNPFPAANFSRWVGLVIVVAICIGVGLLGAIATRQSLIDWYPMLRKPSWNPPSWIFGPVWTTLYIMMAVAAWLIWQINGPFHRLGLGLFVVQLILNAFWSPLFFGIRSPGLALIDIIALWIAILATTLVFSRSSRVAAALLLPYLVWVSFATGLNFELWKLNP